MRVPIPEQSRHLNADGDSTLAAYLRSFPFDKIKIDRSFVSELASRDGSMAVRLRVSETASESRQWSNLKRAICRAEQNGTAPARQRRKLHSRPLTE
jgi:hypothetical protein